jgi:hypothetical protein
MESCDFFHGYSPVCQLQSRISRPSPPISLLAAKQSNYLSGRENFIHFKAVDYLIERSQGENVPILYSH